MLSRRMLLTGAAALGAGGAALATLRFAGNHTSGAALSYFFCGGLTRTGATVVARLSSAGTSTLAVDTDSNFGSPELYPETEVNSFGTRFAVTGLSPDTEYFYRLRADGEILDDLTGRFKTLPSGNSFRFAAGGDSGTDSEATVFDRIRTFNPYFFVHPGDFHYANINSSTPSAHVTPVDSSLAVAVRKTFHAELPLIRTYGDHDFCGDGSDGTFQGRAAAISAYRSIMPYASLAETVTTRGIWHSHQVGNCIFIASDVRSDRSPHGNTDNASKTMLGARQKAWWKALVADPANADKFFFWVNDSPWIETTGTGGSDRWGAYNTERVELANWIKANCAGRICIIASDMHAIAFDDGTNSDYATGGGAPIPVMHCAPLDRPNSTRGGPYTDGPYDDHEQQFAIIDVADDNNGTLTVTFTGYYDDGAGSTELTEQVFQLTT